MVIIQTGKEFDSFLLLYSKSDVLIHPITSTNTQHPARDILTCLFITVLDTKEDYCINLNHPDSFTIPVNRMNELNTNNKKYCLDKKRLLHLLHLDGIIDLEYLYWIQNGEQIDLTYTNELYRKFSHLWGDVKYKKINHIIPISKHIELYNKLKVQLLPIIAEVNTMDNEGDWFFNDKVLSNFQEIENAGLKVDVGIFNANVVSRKPLKTDTIYTEYNLYTSAGRPSNKFSRINFAALPKQGELRSAFISRFGNDGMLIEFDYDSYHLRLIADIVGFTLPIESVHTYFGRLYFNKETLTDEEYIQSKNITFSQLYGHIQEEYKDFEFFKAVDTHIKKIWKDFKRTGCVVSPKLKRQLYFKSTDWTPQKLMNYYIQNAETEYNVIKIEEILNYLKDKQSKLILYTYDSFLFDFNKNDGKDVLLQINTILNAFPVHIKIGKNYKNLQPLYL